MKAANFLEQLVLQERLFAKICNLFGDARSRRLNSQQRAEHLSNALKDPNNGLLSFPAIPIPYPPTVMVDGIMPEKLFIFNSISMPVKLTFATVDSGEHTMVVKAGESLRQDQLVLGVLELVDSIWKKNGLDLRLTHYHCVSLSF